ncbi:MAG: NAD-binding protein [Flavobacteriaceae bacterium]|nr:NAD-binding protein [Flavobacteriaceae bacterium]
MKFIHIKLYKAVLLLFLVVTIGVIGHMFLSDLTFVEALYMTIITISTVGFGVLRPLNDIEKLFTIFLILLSIGVYGYVVSVFTEYIVEGHIFKQLKLKKVQQKIQKLANHTIICGYGRNGKQSAVKLMTFNEPFIIIEKDAHIIKELDKNGILFVEGDATDDKVLLQAMIQNAKNLITALPSDADNLFVVLSASQLNKSLKIVSRASLETSSSKLKIAGADNVIMPDKLGGDHMASLLVTPDLIEFVDKLNIEGDCSTNLKEIAVNDLPNHYLHKTISDTDIRRKTGCSVIGFKTAENEYIINPESDTILEENTNLILLGRPEQIQKLHELF